MFVFFNFSQKYSNRKHDLAEVLQGHFEFSQRRFESSQDQNSNHDNQNRQQASTITTSPIEAVITDLWKNPLC